MNEFEMDIFSKTLFYSYFLFTLLYYGITANPLNKIGAFFSINCLVYISLRFVSILVEVLLK